MVRQKIYKAGKNIHMFKKYFSRNNYIIGDIDRLSSITFDVTSTTTDDKSL